MAVWKRAGSFVVTGASGAAKVVTGLPGTPSCYGLVTVNRNGDGTSTSHLYLSEGVTDGTRQGAISIGMEDARTSNTAVRKSLDNDCVLRVWSTAGADAGKLAHGSLDANGFTVNVSTNFAATATVYWWAIGGLDAAYLDIFQLPTDAPPFQFSRTAANFQPDAIKFWTVRGATLGILTAEGVFAKGWSVAGVTQFGASIRTGNAQTFDYSSGAATTARALAVHQVSGGTELTPALTVDSHDATGFTATKNLGTSALYVMALHLKGGVWKAGTTAPQNSVAAFDVATAGCNPVGVFLLSAPPITANGSAESAALQYGFADDQGSQVGLTVLDHDVGTVGGGAPTETYSRAVTDKAFIHYARTATDTFAAAGEMEVAMGAKKFTLDETHADPTAVMVGYLAVGNAPVSIAVLMHHLRQQGIC